jgi:hypothetical protein
MEKEDIIRLLEEVGFKNIVILEDDVNADLGNSLTLYASSL